MSTTSGSRSASRRRSRRRGRRRGTRRRPRAGGRGRLGAGSSLWTRRRARLASWRAAGGLRPTIGAISSKGTPNMSCRTNASRSAGVRVSSTTSSASPTESASSASCSGSVAVGSATGSGSVGLERLLAPDAARAACSGRRARRPWSASRRGSRSPRVGAAEPQPGLLDRVVGLARSSRACGRPPRAAGSGAPRSAPASHSCRPSVTFLRRVVVINRPAERRRCDRRGRQSTTQTPILVTGGTGTLGRLVVPRLRDAGAACGS